MIDTLQFTVHSILIVCRKAATPEMHTRMEKTAINDLMECCFKKDQSCEYLKQKLQLAMQIKKTAEREKTEKKTADISIKQKRKKKQQTEDEKLEEPSVSKKISRLMKLF